MLHNDALQGGLRTTLFRSWSRSEAQGEETDCRQHWRAAYPDGGNKNGSAELDLQWGTYHLRHTEALPSIGWYAQSGMCCTVCTLCGEVWVSDNCQPFCEFVQDKAPDFFCIGLAPDWWKYNFLFV